MFPNKTARSIVPIDIISENVRPWCFSGKLCLKSALSEAASDSIGNTLDSHHLIWKAREDFRSDLQDRAVQSVFRTYFEEYSSIGGPLATNDFTECVCMGVSSVLRSGTDAGKMVGQNRYGGLL